MATKKVSIKEMKAGVQGAEEALASALKKVEEARTKASEARNQALEAVRASLKPGILPPQEVAELADFLGYRLALAQGGLVLEPKAAVKVAKEGGKKAARTSIKVTGPGGLSYVAGPGEAEALCVKLEEAHKLDIPRKKSSAAKILRTALPDGWKAERV